MFKLGENLTSGNQNQINTELKVEIKEEPLKDLHMVHDNSKQNDSPLKTNKEQVSDKQGHDHPSQVGLEALEENPTTSSEIPKDKETQNSNLELGEPAPKKSKKKKWVFNAR